MEDLYTLKRQFLEHCELEKNQSELTIGSYNRYIDRFLEYVRQELEAMRQETKGEIIDTKAKSAEPKDVTQELVRKYRLHVNRLKDQQGQELKKTTQNYHMLALRAFLRYLAYRGIDTLSPEKVPVAKADEREISFLEGDEVRQILTIPGDDEAGLRDKAILELLFSTGLRVSEMVSLDVEDLNFDRDEIAVLGKGKKFRVVFLSESAKSAITGYLALRGYDMKNLPKGLESPLFISSKQTRLGVRSVERIVSKYAKRAGITKAVTPHTLRHSFATDLLIGGADIRSVQSMLGHSSITTTQVYTHVTDQHLRETHKKFHGKTIEPKPEDLSVEL